MSTEKGTYQAPAGAAVPVKGEVVATQPAETIAVVAGGTPWPVQLCCYDNCNCCADLPLCCYAAWCAPCLWAEAAEYLQVNTLRSPQDAECCQPCCCCTSCPLRHELLDSDGLRLRDVPGAEPLQCHGLPVDQFIHQPHALS